MRGRSEGRALRPGFFLRSWIGAGIVTDSAALLAAGGAAEQLRLEPAVLFLQQVNARGQLSVVFLQLRELFVSIEHVRECSERVGSMDQLA